MLYGFRVYVRLLGAGNLVFAMFKLVKSNKPNLRILYYTQENCKSKPNQSLLYSVFDAVLGLPANTVSLSMEMFPSEWMVTEEENDVLIDGSVDLTSQQFAALYNENCQRTFASSSNTRAVNSSAEIWNSGSGTTEEIKAAKVGEKNKRDGNHSAKSLYTLEHTVAERKRREKLSQQIIALSAIVPDLKKTDKVSVLGACMTYIKHLQARVKELEDQTASKKTIESAIFVRNIQVPSNTDESSSDFSHKPPTVLEVRISDRNVMIRIHCEKHRGVTAQILLETEKLNLSVTSSSVLSFGNSFDIIVMAQMDVECNITVKDMAKMLGSSLVLSQN